MDGYEILAEARNPSRLSSMDFISRIFTDFTELHGDRRYGDDNAVIGGLAFLNGKPVTVIGIEKGKNTEERIMRNFGEAMPEGYRKALRLMKQAEKFRRPVICFVDTVGAYCGTEAEQRGQGQAIAENLYELSTLNTPVISIIIGEGGSGGALALAVADRIFMLENAYFSVVSPESCASILWKDATKVKEAADALKFTASDLKSFGIIDKVIPERSVVAETVKNLLIKTVAELEREEDLAGARYIRYRKMGVDYDKHSD